MRLRLVSLALAVAVTACSPRVTTIGEEDAGPPDTLTLTGEVCTSPPDPAGFPVKVLLLIDQSGSMCINDPPGSQQSVGFCETFAADAGATQPVRVRATLALLNRLALESNVQVEVIPFATSPSGSLSGFSPASDPSLVNQVTALQAQLGAGADYQGALAQAYGRISSDIFGVEQTAPEILPRTRYVVVLLTDGPPNPRCNAADALTAYADDAHPELTWPDTTSLCNDNLLPDGGVDPAFPSGFMAGEDRNQNDQLFLYVDALKALQAEHHVGGISLHTRLLFNLDKFDDCGPICLDMLGADWRWPGPVAVPINEKTGYAHTAVSWLLAELARRGGGTFAESLDGASISAFDYGSVDVTSLAADNLVRRLMVEPLSSVAVGGAWVSDLDGDRVPDTGETAAGTSPVLEDTDGDGFGDRFELDHLDAGFDPLVRDARGCDPDAGATAGCVVRDPDGDGLSQYAESWLMTRNTFVDGDRDGFPDGFEVARGLDPTVRLEAGTDTDGDGVTDAEELQRGSDPSTADRPFSDRGIVTTIDEEFDGGMGTTCYRWTTKHLPLRETAASGAAPAGANVFKVWLQETPRGVTEDLGTWRVACAWARRDGELLVPDDLRLTVEGITWTSPATFPTHDALMTNRCDGWSELGP